MTEFILSRSVIMPKPKAPAALIESRGHDGRRSEGRDSTKLIFPSTHEKKKGGENKGYATISDK